MEGYLAKTKEINNFDTLLEAWNIDFNFHDTFAEIKKFVNNIFYSSKDNEIINYINKHEDILKDFLLENKNIILEIQENLNNPNKLNYIYSEILAEIFNKSELSVNYEWIVDKKWNIVFHEWLLRVKSEFNFNHFDLLDYAKISWKTLSIFNKMFLNIVNDINEKKISWPISINAEVSDILNPNFIPKIKEVIKNNNLNLKKQIIIIEILENQKIPDTENFFQKIIKLKEMGFAIAFDDIFSEKVWLQETIKNLEILNYNIDIIKIDWKKIHDLYNIYKKIPNSKIIIKCSKTIKLAQNKWIKVVAEWIETEDMLFFSKEILWVDFFQGFLFKK